VGYITDIAKQDADKKTSKLVDSLREIGLPIMIVKTEFCY